MEQSGSITTGNLAAREICARISFTGELSYSPKPKMIHSAPPRRLFICRLQSPTSSLRLPTSTDVFFNKVRSQTRRFPAALSHQLRSRAHVYLRFCCSPQLFSPHPSFFSPPLNGGRPLQYWKALQVGWGWNTEPINMTWIKEISVIITKAGTNPNTAEVPENWFAVFTQAQQ